MELKTMPKETLAELLFFLAENEEFTSIQQHLAEGVTVEEVRMSLKELGEVLRKEAATEADTQYNPQKDVKLTGEVKKVISYLSPGEEKTLLTAFGFVEKPKTTLAPKVKENPLRRSPSFVRS